MYLQVIQILRPNFENVYTQELAAVSKACVLGKESGTADFISQVH
jgi:hypothetical protein